MSNKMANKRIQLLFFICLSLLLPLFLYLSYAPTTDHLEDPDNGTGIVDDPTSGDMVNYYNLIYKDKDPEVGLEGKEKHIALTKPEPEPQPAPRPSGGSSSTAQKEQQMINYINEARRNAGLPDLHVNGQLMQAARAKSKDMVVYNYFSHSSPTYGDFIGLLQSFGVTFSAAGENLAHNSSGNVSEAHNMLMNSPGHRDNILSRSYFSVGVGIYVRSDGRHYYTQLFIGR